MAKPLTRPEVEELIRKHIDATKVSANGKCPSCGHCNVCGHTPSPRPLPWWGSPWVSPYITWGAPRWEWIPNGITYTSGATTTQGQFTVTNETLTGLKV